MRRLLSEIGERLGGFISQREDLALILCSPAPDSLPLLKILEGLEEASTSDLYWTVTDAFVDAASYADAVITGFATRHEVARLEMARRNMTPWPPMPPRILSGATSPAERLRELAAFSRELLPVRHGGSNVWIFYPLDVGDQTAFAGLMADLLRHDFPFPWCHHLRFIIRDDPGEGALRMVLARSPRIQWYEPDLSLDAVNRSLEAEVADESLPLAERMASLPVMAGNDFAWARYPEALAKYELLLRYNAPLHNYAMAAFALNGMGEVYEKLGDLERANDSYEAALIPASHGDQPAIPILLNVVVNLGNLCMRQARWRDGEAYHGAAQQLATVARNATAKIESLEHRGVCQQRQGKLDEAAASWSDGAVIAAQLQDVDWCRTLLGHLERHYVATRQIAKAHELGEQLAALASPSEVPAWA